MARAFNRIERAYIYPMKKFVPVLAVAVLLSAPAASQEAEDNGFSLMEEGARMLLRGLMQEVEPALEDLQSLAEEAQPALRDFMVNMGPALRDLLTRVEDWSVYHPPEVLPNGDIIIRRKTPLEPSENGEIEL